MILNSIKPNKVPNLAIWLDFSDESSLQLSSQDDLADFILAVDKVNGNTFSTTSGFTSPVYKKSAMNNKGALYFGSGPTHITSNAYSDCIGHANLLSENNGFDTIYDSERTIFMVYSTLDTTYLSGTISNSTLTSPNFAWTKITGGTYGCIMNIPIGDFYYIDSSENSYDWTTWEMSFINLLKYKDNPTFSYCNYLNNQGLTDQLSSNDDTKRFTYNNNLNTPTLFFLSSKDYNNSFVYSNYEPRFSTSGSMVNLASLPNSGTFVSSGYEPRFSLFNIYLGNTGDKVYSQKFGFCGYIGEFLYYKRKLSEPEVKQVKNYLRKKWGL
jgi:hypothetical protein